MNKVLIVVDMQVDFVNGSLGTADAESVVKNVVEKVENFDGRVIFTKDTHGKNYMETQEGSKLPVKHCIKDTPGWEIIPELRHFIAEHHTEIYEKSTFGSDKLARRLLDMHHETPIDSVTIVGLCTDICVVSNAILLKTFLPEVPIIVDSGCCAGVTKHHHEAALETMQSCQIEVI